MKRRLSYSIIAVFLTVLHVVVNILVAANGPYAFWGVSKSVVLGQNAMHIAVQPRGRSNV